MSDPATTTVAFIVGCIIGGLLVATTDWFHYRQERQERSTDTKRRYEEGR